MKQQSIALLLVSTFMSFQALAQTTEPLVPKSTECFFCNGAGQPVTIGSNNPPRLITDLTVVGKPKAEGLPSAFEPDTLVDIDPEYMTPLYRPYYTPDYIASGKMEKMRTDAYEHIKSMLNAAHASHIDLFIHSAYRSYEIQCQVFSKKLVDQLVSHKYIEKMNVAQFKNKMRTELADLESGTIPNYFTNGELNQSIAEVNTRSALPGQSEHQLGSVADLVTRMPRYEKPETEFSGYALENDMQDTLAFLWLKQNAYKYGYVLSYPSPVPLFAKDVTQAHPRTGYIYEPWHWRYIGTKRALDYQYCGGKYVLREYLKQVAVNPKFSCVKTPAKKTTPAKPKTAAKAPVKKTAKKTTYSWFFSKSSPK